MAATLGCQRLSLSGDSRLLDVHLGVHCSVGLHLSQPVAPTAAMAMHLHTFSTRKTGRSRLYAIEKARLSLETHQPMARSSIPPPTSPTNTETKCTCKQVFTCQVSNSRTTTESYRTNVTHPVGSASPRTSYGCCEYSTVGKAYSTANCQTPPRPGTCPPSRIHWYSRAGTVHSTGTRHPGSDASRIWPNACSLSARLVGYRSSRERTGTRDLQDTTRPFSESV